MTDPISVLLIVGAAVIGPIEARTTGLTNECAGLKDRPPSIVACLKYETLPELCARAMKEIGAIALTFPHEKGTRTEWLLFDVNAIPPDSFRVYCIPAPSGYRK